MLGWVLVLAANAAMLLLLRRKLVQRVALSVSLTVYVVSAAMALGVGCALLEARIFAWEYLAVSVSERGLGTALLGALLVAAPLEEAAKYWAIWPLARRHRLGTRATGVFFAVSAAAGFTVGEALVWLWSSKESGHALQWVMTTPVQGFCAGLWGYVLASRVRARFFRWAWLGALVIHGFFDFIVFGFGRGMLVLALPPLLAMVAVGSRVVDKVSRTAADESTRFLAALSAPSAQAVRQVLHPGASIVRLRWVAIAGLVTLGTLLVALAGGVSLSQRMGMDFEQIERGDLRANGPLSVLGLCALSTFPLTGYLVAKASAASTVVEPALGASLAILALALLFSLAAPVAAVFVIAVAPVAFGLTCGGAWFALSR